MAIAELKVIEKRGIIVQPRVISHPEKTTSSSLCERSVCPSVPSSRTTQASGPAGINPPIFQPRKLATAFLTSHLSTG